MGKDGQKATLNKTFDESIKVEKDMSSLATNPNSMENKDNIPVNKNKEIKINKEGKEKESLKIENLQ